MIEEPSRGRIEASTVYSWVFGGFLFVFLVLEGVPPLFLQPFILKNDGSIIIVSASAEPILRWWAERLRGRMP